MLGKLFFPQRRVENPPFSLFFFSFAIVVVGVLKDYTYMFLCICKTELKFPMQCCVQNSNREGGMRGKYNKSQTIMSISRFSHKSKLNSKLKILIDGSCKDAGCSVVDTRWWLYNRMPEKMQINWFWFCLYFCFCFSFFKGRVRKNSFFRFGKLSESFSTFWRWKMVFLKIKTYGHILEQQQKRVDLLLITFWIFFLFILSKVLPRLKNPPPAKK